MPAASTLQLDLKPSLKLAGLLLAAHVLALAATWVSLAGWPQVLVGFGILLSASGCLSEVLHRSSRAAVSLELREDGRASWRDRNGGGDEGRRPLDPFFLGALEVFGLRHTGGGRKKLGRVGGFAPAPGLPRACVLVRLCPGVRFRRGPPPG